MDPTWSNFCNWGPSTIATQFWIFNARYLYFLPRFAYPSAMTSAQGWHVNHNRKLPESGLPADNLAMWPWSSSKMFQTQSSFFPANLAVFQPRDCFHCGSGCSCCFSLVPAAPRRPFTSCRYTTKVSHPKKGLQPSSLIPSPVSLSENVWKSANAD